MKIDITLKITPAMASAVQKDGRISLPGHLGTHFDVMDKEFPLEFTERPAVVFDVADIRDREIGIGDIDLDKVNPGMFIAFRTGFIEEAGYGTEKYHKEHPQLSDELIDALLDRQISLIGIDFAGVRRGKEHTPKDQYCADRGVFIIENLCNLGAVLAQGERFTAHTYPMNFGGMTGLPCRVVAEF